MFQYPVTLKREKSGSHLVTFADIPEAITHGQNVDEAMAMAREALDTALDFYFEEKREVPMPSAAAKRGQPVVELPESVGQSSFAERDGSPGRAPGGIGA